MSSLHDFSVTDGFIKRCQAHGLSAEQTTEAMWLQGRVSLLNDPDIAAGFRARLAADDSGLSKAALARYLTPEVIAAAAECQLLCGSGGLVQEMRKAAGIMDRINPPPITLNPTLLDRYNGLTTSQKALTNAILGGGGMGMYRYFHPDNDDIREGRGEMERGIRGAGVGAVAGLGATAGGELGQRLAPAVGVSRGLGQLGGMAAGGVAGSRLMQ